MADRVQAIMEELVPAMEDLQRKEVFSATEVSAIIRKRREFEYRFQRRDSAVDDYSQALKYELNLDKLRAMRVRKLGKGAYKPSIGDYVSLQRVHFIWERCLRKFTDDLGLWIKYVSYCISSGSNKRLGKLFPKALTTHARSDDLWSAAAQWEFYNNNNMSSARIMCQRGLRFVSSAKLWLAFIELEFKYIEKLVKRAALMFSDDDAEGSSLKLVSDAANEDGADGVTADAATGDTNDVDAKDKVILSGALPQLLFRKAVAPAAPSSSTSSSSSSPSSSSSANALENDAVFRIQVLDLIPFHLQSAKSGVDLAPLADEIMLNFESLANSPEEWLLYAKFLARLPDSVWPARWATRCEEYQSAKLAECVVDSSVLRALTVLDAACVEFKPEAGMWHAYCFFVSDVLAAKVDALRSAQGEEGTGAETETPELETALVSKLYSLLLDSFRRAEAVQCCDVGMSGAWVQTLVSSGDFSSARSVLQEALQRLPNEQELWEAQVGLERQLLTADAFESWVQTRLQDAKQSEDDDGGRVGRITPLLLCLLQMGIARAEAQLEEGAHEAGELVAQMQTAVHDSVRDSGGEAESSQSALHACVGQFADAMSVAPAEFAGHYLRWVVHVTNTLAAKPEVVDAHKQALAGVLKQVLATVSNAALVPFTSKQAHFADIIGILRESSVDVHEQVVELCQLSCERFGDADVGVWVQFMDFLRARATAASLALLNQVFHRAMQALPSYRRMELHRQYQA
jgi:Arc/MetJ-type ribon-helix-helix transcriptional regulator